jgi:hypothetical protein
MRKKPVSITEVKVGLERVETKLDSFIEHGLKAIEGKLDIFIKQQGISDDRAAKLDGRVRKIEGRQHWWSGAAAAIGGVLGAVGERTFHS